MTPRFQDPNAELDTWVKPRRKPISAWWLIFLILAGSQGTMLFGHLLWVLERHLLQAF